MSTRAVKPKGALYIFPRIEAKRFNIQDDEKFSLDFLHDKHVLMIRGTGFNWTEPDHFRIVYLPEIGALKTAVENLADFLTFYRQ